MFELQTRDNLESLSTKEFGEYRAALLQHIDSYDVESRDLSDDETQAFDVLLEHLDEIKEIQEARAAKQAEATRRQERLAEARRVLEAREEERETERRVLAGTDREIRVPASAKRIHLRAFESHEDAYLTSQWLLANFAGNHRAQRWCESHIPEYRDMSGTTNAGGGYLVPIQFETAVIRLVEQYGVARRFSRTSVMSSDTKIQPVRSSGLTAYFVTDGNSITTSDAAYTDVELVARKLSTLTKFSAELDEDAAVSVVDQLTQEAATAFANKEDLCAFSGDGTSTYGGVKGLISAVGSAGTVTAATGNTSFGELDMGDFESMIGKLPEYPGIQPHWYIHKAGWAASMQRLLDAAGGNSIADLAAGAGPSFLGYPVTFVQVMNSTLTAQTSTDGLCYFGDLSMGTLFGDRRMMTVRTSEHRYFDTDQIALKVTERFDFKAHSVGDSSNAGAVIMLSTPNS